TGEPEARRRRRRTSHPAPFVLLPLSASGRGLGGGVAFGEGDLSPLRICTFCRLQRLRSASSSGNALPPLPPRSRARRSHARPTNSPPRRGAVNRAGWLVLLTTL